MATDTVVVVGPEAMALECMELTTEEEIRMFHRVRKWWEGRSFRMSIQVDPIIVASLLARALLAFHTDFYVDQENSTDDTNKPPKMVSPDETGNENASEKAVGNSETEKEASLSHGERRDSTDDSQTRRKGGNTTGGIRNLESTRRFDYFCFLVSDMASLLVANDAGRKDSSLASPPTVAYIANAYVSLLKSKNDDTPSEVASDMHRSIVDVQKTASQADLVTWTKLLQYSLAKIGRASRDSVEGHYDFEYLWSSCATNASIFRTDVNEHGKRTSQPTIDNFIKNIAWKLCYSALLNDHNSTRHGGQQASPKEAESGRRRKRILVTAACLLLLSKFLPENESPTTQAAPTQAAPTQVAPTQAAPTQAAPTQAAPTQAAATTPKDSAPAAKRPARSKEEDAIVALSMMVNGSFESSPTADGARTATTSREAPAKDVIFYSANALLSNLRIGSTPRSVVEFSPKISQKELETAALTVAEQLASSMPSDDNAPPPIVDKSAGNFELSLKTLFPTRADFQRLIDNGMLDSMRADGLRIAIEGLAQTEDALTLDGFLLTDEMRLAYGGTELMSRLCKTTTRTKTPGTALICHYDGRPLDIEDAKENEAVENMTNEIGDIPDRGTREVMELNEWTVSVLSSTDVRPSTRLMLYLEASDDDSVKQKKKRADGVMEEVFVGGGWRSVIIPVLNRVIERLIEDGDSDSETSRRLEVSKKNGEVVVKDNENDVHVKLGMSLIALYYHSLESILFHETARLKSASHPRLLLSEAFHRALLTCCCVCLMHGLGRTSGALELSDKYRDLDFQCMQQIMESGPYTYLKVSESFARALKLDRTRGKLKSTLSLGLPRLLQRQLSQCEVMIIDSLLWAHEKVYALDELSVMDVVSDMQSLPSNTSGASTWPPEVLLPTLPEEIADIRDKDAKAAPKKSKGTGGKDTIPPDHLFLNYVLRKLLKIAFFRISAFCRALDIPPAYPIASQVWIAFRYLLRHNMELLYDRHVDQLILCTLYGVCKIMKFEPDLTFSKVIEIYTQVRGSDLGNKTCHRLVRHMKLVSDEEAMDSMDDGKSPKKKKTRTHGNVIHFYNAVFVPAMKSHLLHSNSLKLAIADLAKHMTAARKGKKIAPSKSVEDAGVLAARADRLAHAGNWANEPSVIPIREGNIKMDLRCPNLGENSPLPNGTQSKRKKTARPLPKSGGDMQQANRVFYTLGDIGNGTVQLMNRIVREGKK